MNFEKLLSSCHRFSGTWNYTTSFSWSYQPKPLPPPPERKHNCLLSTESSHGLTYRRWSKTGSFINVKRVLIENSFSSDCVTVPANWSKCASDEGSCQLHQTLFYQFSFSSSQEFDCKNWELCNMTYIVAALLWSLPRREEYLNKIGSASLTNVFA